MSRPAPRVCYELLTDGAALKFCEARIARCRGCRNGRAYKCALHARKDSYDCYCNECCANGRAG